MEQTLHALQGILLKSIPTICLLVFLYFYLKLMLFGPLQQVLKKRDALTIGTRQAADQSLKEAEHKVQEYEARLREARAEVYREQEDLRQGWLADQAGQIAQAREASAAKLAQAREQMAADTAAARESLADSSSALADQIAAAVLSRSVR